MTISVEHIRKMKLPQKVHIASSNQNRHKISLTLNARRGTLPKHLGQSSRYTFRSSGSATKCISIRNTLNKGCAGTILRADWVCVLRRQLQKCRLNCTFSKKRCCKGNAPVIHPVWTKERWNSVQRRPNTRDDAAEQDASFQMTLWTRVR